MQPISLRFTPVFPISSISQVFWAFYATLHVIPSRVLLSAAAATPAAAWWRPANGESSGVGPPTGGTPPPTMWEPVKRDTLRGCFESRGSEPTEWPPRPPRRPPAWEGGANAWAAAAYEAVGLKARSQSMEEAVVEAEVEVAAAAAAAMASELVWRRWAEGVEGEATEPEGDPMLGIEEKPAGEVREGSEPVSRLPPPFVNGLCSSSSSSASSSE